MVELAVAVAAGIAAAALTGYVSYRKGVSDGRDAAEREASKEAHDEATERAPPVDIGDRVSLGVKEFKQHHSGDQVAVCKKEGFVIFVDGVPESADVGDVVDVEVVSFGPDRNSAEGSYVGN